MQKLFLFFAIHLFLIGNIVAQEAVFSVILNKGENSFGTSGNFQPILLGTSLHDDDVVNVGNGGYLALVHETTGASLELNEKGNYRVVDMVKSVQSQSATILAKYGKFLMSKLDPDDNGNQNLNVTGAVERGDVEVIRVNLPKVMDVYGNHVCISWHQIDDVDNYILTIKDKLDELIDERPVNGTSYVINLDNNGLHDEKMIILNVRATGIDNMRSPDFGIKRLSEEDRKVIDKEYINIKKVANTETVLDKLFIASFFEENKLLVDAITCYEEALEISPDPQGFNVLYNNFLARNGLKN